MNYKEFKVKYKDEGTGSIEGYASTWIREPDSYGDIVKEGAFTRTLAEKWNGGKGIPFLWSHKMDELNAFIGKADAEEDEKGLHFVAAFDDTPEAQRVRDLYKDGRLSKFSFAYEVKDAGTVELEDGTKANELRDLDLFEISAVCVPANDDAGVVDVKAPVATATVKIVPEIDEKAFTEALEKAGRRNSQKDADAIREAIALLQGVLGELDNTDEEAETEDEPKANAAAEEPKGAEPENRERLLSYIKQLKTTASMEE